MRSPEKLLEHRQYLDMKAEAKTSRRRLDTVVVEKGFAETRNRAQALILAGHVRVNDVVASKAGTAVSMDSNVTLDKPDHIYVGRGGVKLAHALSKLHVTVRKRNVLDIGASTGGFTDVALRSGAFRVIALDVGRGQLAWKLRQDTRVTVLEGINARYLTLDLLPKELQPIDVITIDVSFISATLILPAVQTILAPDGDIIVLVKPQFEAGRPEVGKHGIVTDPTVHRRVVDHVARIGSELGLARIASVPSPILGAEGNKEFFLHLRHGAAPS